MSSTDITSKGKHETALLKANIHDQLNRLLTQLEDLEELKDEFTDAEYTEIKTETLDQLRDFQAFLEKTLRGDLTLIDEFGAAQLAIQAAVSNAFHTPEVIRLFAKRQPDQLRVRLESIRRDYKVKKITKDVYARQVCEILLALRNMQSELTADEEAFLQQYNPKDSIGDSRSASTSVRDDSQMSLMSQASAQIKRAAH